MPQRKVAVFVEGMTEVVLTRALLKALCGRRGCTLELWRQYKNRLVLSSSEPTSGAQSFVLLVDCSCDAQVKSQIIQQYPTLVTAGYDRIIGLRDIYPNTHADVPHVQAALGVGLPVGSVPIEMHAAVLETEAWFLDELTHFARVEPRLTPGFLGASGFDVAGQVGADWPAPADALDRIYKLVGFRYSKKGKHVRRTVSALSLEELYLTVPKRAPSFAGFLASLERGLF